MTLTTPYRREAILRFCLRNCIRYGVPYFNPASVMRRSDGVPIPWRMAGVFSVPAAYTWELLVRFYGARLKPHSVRYVRSRMSLDRDALSRAARRSGRWQAFRFRLSQTYGALEIPSGATVLLDRDLAHSEQLGLILVDRPIVRLKAQGASAAFHAGRPRTASAGEPGRLAAP